MLIHNIIYTGFGKKIVAKSEKWENVQNKCPFQKMSIKNFPFLKMSIL